MSFELTMMKIITQKVYNSTSLSNLIDGIYESIISVYTNFSGAFKQSAAQALKAADTSTNPEAEVRSAINEYRNAYNTLVPVLSEMRIPRFPFLASLFGIKKEPLIDKYQQPRFYTELSKLSFAISILYNFLREGKNASDWKSWSADNYGKSLSKFNIPANELQKLDPMFVVERQYEDAEIDPYGGNFVTTTMRTELVASELGQRYIEKVKSQMVEDFKLHFEDAEYTILSSC